MRAISCARVSLCITKLNWQEKSAPDVENFFKDREVTIECLFAGFGEPVIRLRAAIAGEFLPGDELGLFQGPQVGDEIAVAHVELRLEVLERPRLHAGSEQRHDGEPPLLVDGPIQL